MREVVSLHQTRGDWGGGAGWADEGRGLDGRAGGHRYAAMGKLASLWVELWEGWVGAWRPVAWVETREVLKVEGQGERCGGEERELEDRWTGHCCVLVDLL